MIRNFFKQICLFLSSISIIMFIICVSIGGYVIYYDINVDSIYKSKFILVIILFGILSLFFIKSYEYLKSKKDDLYRTNIVGITIGFLTMLCIFFVESFTLICLISFISIIILTSSIERKNMDID